MIAHEESEALDRKLIEEKCRRQGIEPDQLTLHADRGSSMTSKSVALLLADLGVTKTHSRPHVSNDNPFSESAFKTLKYRPGFPDRFVHIEHARDHGGPFFDWYNNDHHHGSLGLRTPHDVHYGLAAQTLLLRGAVLDAAFLAPPGALPAARTASRPGDARRCRGLDQQARAGGRERLLEVNSPTGCLTRVDRLRGRPPTTVSARPAWREQPRKKCRARRGQRRDSVGHRCPERPAAARLVSTGAAFPGKRRGRLVFAYALRDDDAEAVVAVGFPHMGKLLRMDETLPPEAALKRLPAAA